MSTVKIVYHGGGEQEFELFINDLSHGFYSYDEGCDTELIVNLSKDFAKMLGADFTEEYYYGDV